MSVGVLLLTHNRIGEELLDTTKIILGFCPLATEQLGIPRNSDPAAMAEHGLRLLAALDDGDGVLILTDAFGATPSNVAARLAARPRTAVIAGLNLPMLLRVYNYPALSLADLTDKALSGGRDGILTVQPDNEQE